MKKRQVADNRLRWWAHIFPRSDPYLFIGIAGFLVILGRPCIGSSPHENNQQEFDEAKIEIEVVWRDSAESGRYWGQRSWPSIASNGSSYIAAGHYLYALDSNGSEKWRFDTGASVEADVASDDGKTIYVASEAVWALGSDGALKWKIPITWSSSSSVAMGTNDQVYFANKGKLCAASRDGKIKWEHDLDVSSAPIVGHDGTIFVGGVDGEQGAVVRALDSNGAVKWSFMQEKVGYHLSALAADDRGRVYFGRKAGNLCSLDANGQLDWIFPTAKGVYSAPAIGPDHTIYFGCADGNLYAVHPNGDLKWKYAAKGPILSSPAVDSNGGVYFATRSRNLYCLNSDGSLKKVLAIKGAEKGAGTIEPIIGENGVLYLRDEDALYALRGLAVYPGGPWPMRRHDASGTGRVFSK